MCHCNCLLWQAPPNSVSLGQGKGHYCIHPDWIRSEVRQSAARLGTNPDIVLLHNPDFLLSAIQDKEISCTHDIFHAQVRKAFACLEELVEERSIGSYYGVSCNPRGCLWSSTGTWRSVRETPSLPRLIEDAASVGTSGSEGHRMRVLQMPLNLLELGGAMAYKNPTTGDSQGMPIPQDAVTTDLLPSPLRVAKAANVSVMVNRCLHAIPPAGLVHGDWGRNGGGLQDDGRQYLCLRDTRPQSPVIALLQRAISEACVLMNHPQASLNEGAVDIQQLPQSLQQLALWVMASTIGVDVALCGARQRQYVRDLAAISALPRLREQTVWSIFDRVQDVVEDLVQPPRPNRRL